MQIEGVDAGSIAQEVGLEGGDLLRAINGQAVRDELDYRFLAAEEQLMLEVKKLDGSLWEVEIEKDAGEELGIDFGSGGMGNIKKCTNRCMFCFVDQMTPGLRKTLYIKDDDYRYSFLHGNFITLTNAGPEEIERIVEQRLSPLYVSVHAVNPGVRVKLMHNPRAGNILKLLKKLTHSGITIHAQVVLCPGVNDGEELAATYRELSQLWPGVASLGVVPVGLTGYRAGLANLRPFSPGEALGVVEQIKLWQSQSMEKFNYPFIFAADEFYVLSGAKIPPLNSYADFPQTENGVGLLRLFWEEWQQVEEIIPEELPEKKRVILVTGESMGEFLQIIADRLGKVVNLDLQLRIVKNSFFGGNVSVAGLLTYSDLAAALGPQVGCADLVILPLSALNPETGIFLDGPSLGDLEKEIDMPVRAAGGPSDILRYIANVSI